MTDRLIVKGIVMAVMTAAILLPAENTMPANGVTVTVQANQSKNISPDRFGIFFEVLNCAAATAAFRTAHASGSYCRWSTSSFFRPVLAGVKKRSFNPHKHWEFQ